MKIIIENLITSVRILTAAFAFSLYIVIGVLVGAEPLNLLLGGLITWALGYILGMAIANILLQINKENTLVPAEEKEDHHETIGMHLDVLQGAEAPRAK